MDNNSLRMLTPGRRPGVRADRQGTFTGSPSDALDPPTAPVPRPARQVPRPIQCFIEEVGGYLKEQCGYDPTYGKIYKCPSSQQLYTSSDFERAEYTSYNELCPNDPGFYQVCGHAGSTAFRRVDGVTSPLLCGRYICGKHSGKDIETHSKCQKGRCANTNVNEFMCNDREDNVPCDGRCVTQECLDEMECNGVSYGMFCTKEFMTPSHIPPRSLCDGKILTLSPLLLYPTILNMSRIQTCLRSDIERTIGVPEGARCAPWYRTETICKNGEDQINCTDPDRVTMSCLNQGHNTTISFLGHCRGFSKTPDQKGMELAMPLAWVMDGHVDCIDGSDEMKTSWTICGSGAYSRYSEKGQGHICTDVLICGGEDGFVELDKLCDKISSCPVEVDLCNAMRNNQVVDTSVTLNQEVYLQHCFPIPSSSLELQLGKCHTVTQPSFTLPTVLNVIKSVHVNLPLQSFDCRYMYGENYVYSACSRLCYNADCPLNKTVPLETCWNMPDKRVYALADTYPPELVVEKFRRFLGPRMLVAYKGCDNQKCVFYRDVCNLKDDCGDGSDEVNCVNNFQCTTSGTRIPLSSVCDGQVDCVDLSDECNEKCPVTKKHILANDGLRAVCYIVGPLASLLNLMVLIVTIRKPIKRRTFELLANKLAIILICLGDLLVGVYLLSISVFDFMFRRSGGYCRDRFTWFTSTQCQILGVVSTTGSQLSIFAMTSLSVVRVFSVGKLIHTDGEDQINCTDPDRVTMSCLNQGHNTTISFLGHCRGYDLCDDGYNNVCFEPETGCTVHKNQLCDAVRDCQNGGDETADLCSRVTQSFVCERRFSKTPDQKGRELAMPLVWVMDGHVDCMNGSDEMETSWTICGSGAYSRYSEKGQGHICTDVLICGGNHGFVELDKLCDKISSCSIEVDLCNAMRNNQVVDTSVTLNQEVFLQHCFPIPSSSLEIQLGKCHTVIQPSFTLPTVLNVIRSVHVNLPLNSVDCRYLYGENYVYSACNGLCDNAECPLNKTVPLETCWNMPDKRVYALSDTYPPELVVLFKASKDPGSYDHRIFPCDNRKCVFYRDVCNLKDDCGDGSDEVNCVNNFQCTTSGTRIPLSSVCDGHVDCVDLSDECNEKCPVTNKHILANDGLRAVCYIVGPLASLLNLLVLIVTIRKPIKRRTFELLANKLAIILICLGDLLVGIYLLSISVFDFMFRRSGSYCRDRFTWFTSTQCQILGVVSTTGSQLSIFAMTSLSVVRVFSVGKLIHTDAGSILSVIKLVILTIIPIIGSVIIAVIPILTVFEDYFVNGLYYNGSSLFRGSVTKTKHLELFSRYYSRISVVKSADSMISWRVIREMTRNMFTSQYGGIHNSTVHFYGNDGVCVFKDVCNLKDDCGDGSDEVNCVNNFQCTTSGTRIPLSSVCDGQVDCVDLSDECNEKCPVTKKHILANDGLRAVCYIVGPLASLLNLMVLIVTIRKPIKRRTFELLANKLAIILICLGDLLVGVYLLSISVFDFMFRRSGGYCRDRFTWFTSTQCQILGVVSTTGSQLSIFAMTSLSVVRVFSVGKLIHTDAGSIFSIIKLGILTFISIIGSVIIAVIPVLPVFEDYFVNGLYYNGSSLFRGSVTKTKHLELFSRYYSRISVVRSADSMISWRVIREMTRNMFTSQYGDNMPPQPLLGPGHLPVL
eukprot:sb/3460744/